MEQQIRFCMAPDGVRLAYAKHGHGPRLVKAPNWLTHLEFDWNSPLWRPWLDALGECTTVIRYDEHGTGLSDWDVDQLSLGAWVTDLETVVDAAGVDCFALLGLSQGAQIAIAYAARHPQRVSHLVLCGGYLRGEPAVLNEAQRQQSEVIKLLMRVGWGQANPAFRRVFATLLVPERVGRAADRAGDMGSVAVAVRRGAAIDGVVAGDGATSELRVAEADSGVDDVGSDAGACGVVGVAVAQRKVALVDAVESPGGRRLRRALT
jgi:pimeloyl-ACP methyl ester carboxylesterase